MESIRLAIGKMPYRRRQNRLAALERVEVNEHWEVILGLLTALIKVALIQNPLFDHIIAAGIVIVSGLITHTVSLKVFLMRILIR